MEFNHFDKNGNAIMVDVSNKEITERIAVASGKIKVNSDVLSAIINHTAKKGDVLGVARVAGIMATKQTSNLIPMCHPLCLNKSTIDFNIYEEEQMVEAICTVKVSGKTGVEMEALMGVNIALLTIYDMCKAIDKSMEILDVHLVLKEGGKSKLFVNNKIPQMIAISGIKNSGKTTFLENLIPLLINKGLKVGVIKHDGHAFEGDNQGTDTYRLKKAGALATAIYNEDRYFVLNDKKTSFYQLASQFDNVDLILCEGLKNSNLKKIEIVRSCNSEESVCDPNTLLAIATDCKKDFATKKIALDDYQTAADLILEYLAIIK